MAIARQDAREIEALNEFAIELAGMNEANGYGDATNYQPWPG